MLLDAGIDLEDEGTPEGSFDTIDFVGAGVSVTDDGGGHATVTVSGGGSLTQAYVGYNTIGASQENITGRRWYLKQITLANDCLLTDIEAYIDAANGVDQVDSFSVALFADNAGAPREILQYNESPAGSLLPDNVSGAGGDQARWFGLAIGRWLVAGDYWIGVASVEAAVGSLRIYYDSGGADPIFTAGGDWVTDAGFTTVTDSTREYSIRANTIR